MVHQLIMHTESLQRHYVKSECNVCSIAFSFTSYVLLFDSMLSASK